ncbi:MAG: translation initiation factor IF-2 [Ignavibacteria bacterium GWB2_35_12]|nr:MAG: translation initiation factor IF-2 [Ignavibacteria bacterium GWA2_35_8]OGU42258.1 MAG: translation initiation factor IF-2 [Ignavibacteria bacterium GWB2_35_12]OGU93523.1 MAG: translation initiation factor IF-2 [Ignavibacteria bacterium RIFOXYA2_FULL_35_10]OGV22167.1 MAG: translation initiation factor IF-2 [Ignavibacteria bacterium RIFOXYC2_FULL_35_21]
MAAGKGIKLFRIATEINIGKDAIVEFLQSKGFAIENKPTATLTEQMIELVHDKFKREMIAAEKQREKIEKHKQIRKSTSELTSKSEDAALKTKEIPKPTVKEREPEKPKTVEVKVETEKAKTKVEKEKVVVSEKISVPETKKLHIIDKIDLDAISLKDKKKPSRKKPAKAKEEIKPQPPIEEKPKKPAIKEKKEAEIPKEKVKVKIETLKPEKEKVISVEISKKVQEVIEFKEEVKPVEDLVITEKPRGKKKRRKKKIAQVQIEPGVAPKLRGLTIVGKIVLNKEQLEEIKDRKERKGKRFDEDDDEVGIIGKGKFLKSRKKLKGKIKERVIDKVRITDKKKKRRISVRDLITDDDIDRAIKQTLAGMEESSSVSLRSRMRSKRRAEREAEELRRSEEKELEGKKIQLSEFVTTSDLANLMGVNPSEIIVKCMELGLMVSINQRLDKDTIIIIADDYDYTVEFLDEKAMQILQDFEEEDEEENLLSRSPIVTVMGHVDHGKTSLLDFIRNSNVVAGEAGGITQHIGAYRVAMHDGKYITFLDTPGHEAFTAMRARGAQVTDIVVLVIAADDSVMPQTVEAISHAQAANVKIIVAINKIDKPEAKAERIKQQLTDYNILVEEWGGKHQSVEISAKTGKNVDHLLEKILLEAELLELKSNYKRKARCAIIEANMDKGFGTVASVVVQKGTLKIGDAFVAGVSSGRVRAMFDERSRRVDEATPSMPVRVIGFDGLPEAGDILAVVDSDIEARAIANDRHQLKREQSLRQVRHVTLDDISKEIKLGGVKDLHMIIKGDVGGSVEALSDSLLRLSQDEVRISILHKGVGSITESDVMLAVASNAVVIGFQVSPTAKARKLAEKEGIDIRLYSIIYDAIDEVKLALEGMLTPELREEVSATIEIRKVFKISKLGHIAGCYVQEGKISRNDRVRLLRDGLPVYNGTIHSLKRNKDDVKEVESGYECGIILDGFQDFEEGDAIQAYKLLEIKRTLN